MNYNLEKIDLVHLVKGCEPTYEQMEHPMIKSSGTFNGSQGSWSWNYGFGEKLSEPQLWEMYQLMRMNWVR